MAMPPVKITNCDVPRANGNSVFSLEFPSACLQSTTREAPREEQSARCSARASPRVRIRRVYRWRRTAARVFERPEVHILPRGVVWVQLGVVSIVSIVFVFAIFTG